MVKEFFYRLLLNSCAIFFWFMTLLWVVIDSERREGNIIAIEIDRACFNNFVFKRFIFVPLLIVGGYFFSQLVQNRAESKEVKAFTIFFTVYWVILLFILCPYLYSDLDLVKNCLDYLFN